MKEQIAIVEGVVAMDLFGVIGKNGQLPWKLATDMKRFRALTLGKTIVMGRKTYESIGRPLPGRKTIVMTSDNNWRGGNWNDSCKTAQSPEQVISESKKDTLMIVGGSEIYKMYLPYMNSIHVTIVDANTKGDIIFPEITRPHRKIRIESHLKDEKNEYDSRFETWIFD